MDFTYEELTLIYSALMEYRPNELDPQYAAELRDKIMSEIEAS